MAPLREHQAEDLKGRVLAFAPAEFGGRHEGAAIWRAAWQQDSVTEWLR